MVELDYTKNSIHLLRYPLNEYKWFPKKDIAMVENISHGLVKLILKDDTVYTIKGDFDEIFDKLNEK